jgi:hypothetical protein
MEPLYASVRDFTQMVGLGRSTVYEMLARDEFSAIKVGARTLIDVPKAREFLATQPKAEFGKISAA